MIQGLADTKNCPVTANGGIVGACILFGHCFTNAYSSTNQIPSFGFNMPNTPACPTASCGATITVFFNTGYILQTSHSSELLLAVVRTSVKCISNPAKVHCQGKQRTASTSRHFDLATTLHITILILQ